MIIDEIRSLANRVGVPITVRGDEYPKGKDAKSEACIMLDRIDKALRWSTTGTLKGRLSILIKHAGNMFAIGDEVEYLGAEINWTGRTGKVTSLSLTSNGAMVKFPSDTRGPRFFTFTNLRKVTIMSIASRVKTALTGLICQAKPATVTLAARDLLAATILCAAADAAKKRAKKVLIDLGITLEEYRPGSVIAFDDSEFTITAVTKEPSSRLDQPLLTINLRNAGLSQAKITSCLNAATMLNKAATSIVVTEK